MFNLSEGGRRSGDASLSEWPPSGWATGVDRARECRARGRGALGWTTWLSSLRSMRTAVSTGGERSRQRGNKRSRLSSRCCVVAAVVVGCWCCDWWCWWGWWSAAMVDPNGTWHANSPSLRPVLGFVFFFVFFCWLLFLLRGKSLNNLTLTDESF